MIDVAGFRRLAILTSCGLLTSAVLASPATAGPDPDPGLDRTTTKRGTEKRDPVTPPMSGKSTEDDAPERSTGESKSEREAKKQRDPAGGGLGGPETGPARGGDGEVKTPRPAPGPRSKPSANQRGTSVAQSPTPNTINASGTFEWVHPWPLNTCAVTGQPLGHAGLVRTIDGREYRFNDADAFAQFIANRSRLQSGIDDAIVRSARRHSPQTTCIASGRALDGDGVIDFIHENRLIRCADANALLTFTESPEQYISKFDSMIVREQQSTYPLEHCIVTNQPLKGTNAISLIFENRLFLVADANAVRRFRDTPRHFSDALDKAYVAHASNATTPMCVVTGRVIEQPSPELTSVAGTTVVHFAGVREQRRFDADPSRYLAELDHLRGLAGHPGH